MQPAPSPCQEFRLGDVRLQSGEILEDARLAYVTLGTLNAAGDNAIVLPTYYTGRHTHYLGMIGPGRALDPACWFIVIPNMFGNGLSTSPSNDARYGPGRPFPLVTVHDNVTQQARLVFDHFGVAELALVAGWSMGGMQAYEWAAQFPDRVQRLLPWCAAARCAPYNAVFLAGLEATLRADPRWDDGRCAEPPVAGLRAFARVYAGWAYSHAFYRDGHFRALGYSSPEALLQGWERDHLELDANDLAAMLRTWQAADITANPRFRGDVGRAFGAIRARTLLLPCSTDRYFPPDDNAEEARLIEHCELRILESPFGHCALSPGRVPAAMAFLERAVAECLELRRT